MAPVMVAPQTNDETGASSPCGIALIVNSKMLHRTGLAVFLLAPLLGGCSGMSAGDMFKSDLLSVSYTHLTLPTNREV